MNLSLLSFLTSSLPGNTGFPWRSSAKIHPTDHMSTAGPYFVLPSNNSGGLFHNNKSNLTQNNQKKVKIFFLVHQINHIPIPQGNDTISEIPIMII